MFLKCLFCFNVDIVLLFSCLSFCFVVFFYSKLCFSVIFYIENNCVFMWFFTVFFALNLCVFNINISVFFDCFVEKVFYYLWANAGFYAKTK